MSQEKGNKSPLNNKDENSLMKQIKMSSLSSITQNPFFQFYFLVLILSVAPMVEFLILLNPYKGFFSSALQQLSSWSAQKSVSLSALLLWLPVCFIPLCMLKSTRWEFPSLSTHSQEPPSKRPVTKQEKSIGSLIHFNEQQKIMQQPIEQGNKSCICYTCTFIITFNDN